MRRSRSSGALQALERKRGGSRDLCGGLRLGGQRERTYETSWVSEEDGRALEDCTSPLSLVQHTCCPFKNSISWLYSSDASESVDVHKIYQSLSRFIPAPQHLQCVTAVLFFSFCCKYFQRLSAFQTNHHHWEVFLNSVNLRKGASMYEVEHWMMLSPVVINSPKSESVDICNISWGWTTAHYLSDDVLVTEAATTSLHTKCQSDFSGFRLPLHIPRPFPYKALTCFDSVLFRLPPLLSRQLWAPTISFYTAH